MRTFPLVFSFVSKPLNSSNLNGMPSLTTSIITIYSKNVQSGKEKCGELTMRKLRTSISYSDGVLHPTLFMLFADWVDRWFYRQMLQMYLNSKCPPGRLWYCKYIQIPNIYNRKDFDFSKCCKCFCGHPIPRLNIANEVFQGATGLPVHL